MISGFVHPDFGGVTESLRRVATHKRGGGAAVAVFHKGDVSGINIESVVIATLGAILVIFVVHLATGSRGLLGRR